MNIPHGGVSIDLLSAAIRALSKSYGHRLMAPTDSANAFMTALANAQHHYKQMTPVTEIKAKKRTTGKGKSTS